MNRCRHRTLHVTNSDKTVSSLYYNDFFSFRRFCDDSDDDDAVETVAVGANITEQRALELAVELYEFVSSLVGEADNSDTVLWWR